MHNQYSNLPHFLPQEDFNEEVQRRVELCTGTDNICSILVLDLNHFNYINDLFGYQTGDLILLKLAEHFAACLESDDIFCREHADVFTFCINSSDYTAASQLFSQLTRWPQTLDSILPPHYSLTASGGAIVVIDDTFPVSSLFDKANYARKKAKGNDDNTLRFYDSSMSEQLQWQKIVTFSMESALKNREFEMYLQPKVFIKTDEIVGAEALVRWNSPQHGLIAPNRFIPILEQNGFIRQLDFFMLQEVCQFLKDCPQNGLPQIPISVNFSKTHLNTERLVERIFQTVNHAGISTSLIEIEFTESLSVSGFEQLIEIVTDLKLLGFKVSLDDFGSAYSSLSCLKELPIDIIKIDKAFLDSSADSEKGKAIVSKVVELIKSLRMMSVMEGVETEEQVDFLKKLSCDFGQGYFYAKPMPARDYMSYLSDGKLMSDIQAYLDNAAQKNEKSYLYVIPQEFQMDNWELYTLGKNIDMGLMKGYLDGEATVQYVNDRALEYLGYTRQEFREIFNNSIVAFTHPDDAAIVRENTEQLIATGKPRSFQTRAFRKDGKVIVFRGRSSCVIDEQGRPVGIHAFQDVTEELERTNQLQTSLKNKIAELEATISAEREAKNALRLSEERYRAVIEQSEDIMFDWDFESDIIHFSDKYTALFGRAPIVENMSTTRIIRERIYSDDLVAFEKWVSDTYKTTHHTTTEFRSRDKKGKYVWLRCHSTAICDESGNAIRAVGLLTDISAQKKEFDTLTFKSQRDPLTKLLNKEETRLQTEALLQKPLSSGAFFIIDIDDFKGINDNLGHQLGDSVLINFTQKIQSFFPEKSVVGRIGGDEIAAFFPGISLNEAEHTAQALVQALRGTYYGSKTKYNIRGSVGVSCFPLHGSSFEDLYHLADIALYESKRAGKDCFTIYHTDMTSSLSDSRTPIEWSERFLNTYFKDDFPFQIFEMLYETKDMNASVQMILELLGQRFDVDRVYIFQNEPDGLAVNNTHEWCAQGITSQKKLLQNIPYESLGVYLDNYTKEGVLCCPDIRNSPREVYDICTPQDIKSLLHCAIYNDGKMAGFIGLDMCRDYHTWTGEEIAILGYISRILSVFLIKSDMALELQTSYQNYVTMLENLNGYVYVVNPDTYDVLYINNAVKSLGLIPGQPCYKMTFGADSPCSNCPINHFTDTVHYASEEIYSQVLDTWVNSAASKFKWEGGIDAVLVCCTDISKYKKGLE